MDEPPTSRGFWSKPQQQGLIDRIPPGQYVTADFPVLSAGPTADPGDHQLPCDRAPGSAIAVATFVWVLPVSFWGKTETTHPTSGRRQNEG
jgi:hypothetical protein